ncbi:MAG TPA: hypothetical protein P5137_15685, partial [Candidatus Brocadiia bacterium]|nr:hypothetical protein [Candidatus Brocadiia bacterium]
AGGEGEEELSGFSIGLNRWGVAACNTHVKSLAGGANYDLLTEAAVTGTRSAAEAVEKVVRLAPEGRYNWANILIADCRGAAVVEVGEDVAVEAERPLVWRANRHLLSHRGQPAGESCPRGLRAGAAVDRARGVEDVFALLRSHEGAEDKTEICRHAQPRTVYSYVALWRQGAFEFYVLQGLPCQGTYAQIPLRFPLDKEAIVKVYPSKAGR